MRKASVRWIGGAKDGSGAMSTESGALKLAHYASNGSMKPSSEADPAELVAAAHAGSFSMALASELGAAGFTPNLITVLATATMEYLSDVWTMTDMKLDVLARAPEATQGDFIDATLRAKSSCSISKLLRVPISMNSKLDSNAGMADSPNPSRLKAFEPNGNVRDPNDKKC